MQLSSGLKTRHNADLTQVFDPVRRRWVALTPEELVRQLLIRYFIDILHFPAARMSVEKQIQVHGMIRRYDLILWNQRPEPLILIECKAPSVPLDQDVMDQIARYNISLRVPYLLVTNGSQSYCCKIDFEKKSWKLLDQLPELE